jgi:dolichol-phosphate mannosyltransferase
VSSPAAVQVDDPRPLLSIIIPALNERDGIAALLARYRDLRTQQPHYAFELIFIDDGSTDGTSEAVFAHSTEADRVTVVTLARNFGAHYAISAGLGYCSGDAAFILGADLPEPDSFIEDCLAHWQAGSDVVWGIRRTRGERGFAYKVMSQAFSILFSRLAQLPNYPAEGPSGALIDRVVIDAVVSMPEHNRNVLALVAWVGFKQTRVSFEQADRQHGQSRWTRRKVLGLAVDSMVQFSSLPLRICTGLGLAVAAAGFLYALVLIVQALLGVETPSGWPTLLVVILVLSGTNLTLLGVMGEYLWRAVEESRGRPLFVVGGVRTSAVGGAHPMAPVRGRRPVPALPQAE